MMKKLIVFTDLDGSLLDHHDYDWTAATPAIETLQQLDFPLIFNSSKTAEEIKYLRQSMNLKSPYICENGSVIHFNKDITQAVEFEPQTKLFAKPYKTIKQTLESLQHKYNYQFIGFADMSAEDVMDYTGLDLRSAKAALKREATEPVIWRDSDEKLEHLRQQLLQHDLLITKGGRFYHIMSQVNKGDAIRYITEKYRQAEPLSEWITIGLGDSLNDLPMLEQVNYPVLIHNPAGNRPDVSHLTGLTETELSGPQGWNQAVLSILKTITGNNHG